MKKKLFALLKLFMLVVFITYYGEVTAFSHIHFLPDKIVTHSHPFLPGHTHSSVEFETITGLSALLFTELIPFIICWALAIHCILWIERSYVLQSKKTLYCSLRAPPAV